MVSLGFKYSMRGVNYSIRDPRSCCLGHEVLLTSRISFP